MEKTDEEWNDDNITVECYFCKKALKRFLAVEAEWIPYFYDRSDIEHGPVCQDCTKERLERAEDGEMIEKERSGF